MAILLCKVNDSTQNMSVNTPSHNRKNRIALQKKKKSKNFIGHLTQSTERLPELAHKRKVDQCTANILDSQIELNMSHQQRCFYL